MTADITATRWMQRALDLAARGCGTTHPNPRVGCVIVTDNVVVGEGWHSHCGQPHAEVVALQQAGSRARGATAYITLEPCNHHGRTPPCTEALIAAGVARVVVAMEDPNPRVAGSGLRKLRESTIGVEIGVCGDAARELNRGFVSRMLRERPWVTLKLAASLDGRTAMASGESRWITGKSARAEVHRLRGEAGAVMTTSATVIADDPRLDVRLPGDWRQPDRIVLDRHGRVAANARVWAPGARRFALMAEGAPAALTNSLQAIGVTVHLVQLDADQKIDLSDALKLLAVHEVNELLVESGPTLAGSLMRLGYVDEIVVHLAPRLLGDLALPMMRLPGLVQLAHAPRLRYLSAILVGEDLQMVLRPLD